MEQTKAHTHSYDMALHILNICAKIRDKFRNCAINLEYIPNDTRQLRRIGVNLLGGRAWR